MTDSNDTTEVLPTAEMPAAAPAAAMPEPAGAPAPAYKTPEAKPATGTSKVLIIVAAVVLGFVVLGTTFASGVMVGTHVGGGRAAWSQRSAASSAPRCRPARRPAGWRLRTRRGGRGHGRGGPRLGPAARLPAGSDGAAEPGHSGQLDRAAPVAHGSGRLSAMRDGRRSDTLIS